MRSERNYFWRRRDEYDPEADELDGYSDPGSEDSVEQAHQRSGFMHVSNLRAVGFEPTTCRFPVLFPFKLLVKCICY